MNAMLKWFRLYGPLFDEDPSAGGGDAGKVKDPETGDSPGDASGKQTDPNAGDDGSKPKKIEFTAEQQAHIDALLADRLERDRKAREKDAEKAKALAAEKALEEQKEWQKLADKRASDLTALQSEYAKLEGVNEQLDRYKGVVEDILKAEVDAVPDTVKELLSRLDPVDQLLWLAKNKKAFMADKGVPETPGEGDLGLSADEAEAAKKRLAQTVYSRF